MVGLTGNNKLTEVRLLRKLRYLDFFAGIGGFHSAFERVGWECVGFCEIDKFARQSYKAIHNVEGAKEWHDITGVTDEEFASLRGQVDVIAGGFPCQAFSVAGKRGGFEDSRGTLFFEVARAAKAIKPKYLILENVKGLLSHDKGNTVDVILRTLNELGYTVDFEVLNTKFFGVPQNRERVFVVAVRDDLVAQEAWDIKGTGIVAKAKKRFSNVFGVKSFNFFGWSSAYDVVGAKLRDVLETEVDAKYYLSDEKTAKLVETLEDRVKVKEATKLGYAEAFPGDAVNLAQPNSKTRRGRVGRELANTLLTGQEQAVVEPQEFTDGSGISYCIDASDAKGTSAGNIGKGRRTHAIEVHALTEKRSEEAKRIRSEYMKIHGKDFSPRRGKVIAPRPDNVANCLTATQTIEQTLLEKPLYRIRKLTPLETWRLQDFTDEQFTKARAAGVSDSQLYKQAGNSVTVKVVEVIAHNLAALDAQLR